MEEQKSKKDELITSKTQRRKIKTPSLLVFYKGKIKYGYNIKHNKDNNVLYNLFIFWMDNGISTKNTNTKKTCK